MDFLHFHRQACHVYQFKDATHRHSPRRGFLKRYLLVASYSYIQLSSILFIVYLFRLPFKIIFFQHRFYLIFWHSLLLKRRKKFAAKNFELWVTLKSNRQNPTA